MEGHYKCCRKKEFTGLICVVCLGVYHPSCLERKKQFRSLEGYKIYCSEMCERGDVDPSRKANHFCEEIAKLKYSIKEREIAIERMEYENRERVDEMQRVIDQLQSDMEQKEVHIKRMSKRTQDFEEEVFEIESRDTQKLKEQSETILRLNREVIEAREEMRRHEADLVSRDGEIDALNNRIRELDQIGREMVESIRILEEENSRGFRELSNLREVVRVLRRRSVGSDMAEGGGSQDVGRGGFVGATQSSQDLDKSATQKAGRIQGEDSGVKPGRILILCDETGRKLRDFIVSKLEYKGYTNYVIETVIKPGAMYESVIEDMIALTSGYTDRDYVIALAGVNDFRNGISPSVAGINSRIRYCTHTNLIFSTVPCAHFGNFTRKCVCRFNNRFEKCIANLDRYSRCMIRVIDAGGERGGTYNNICKAIGNKFVDEIMLGRKGCNLKFIELVDSIDGNCELRPDTGEGTDIGVADFFLVGTDCQRDPV